MNDFLAKPVQHSELVACVQRWMHATPARTA
jgi:FixJ family two-component response regulator